MFFYQKVKNICVLQGRFYTDGSKDLHQLNFVLQAESRVRNEVEKKMTVLIDQLLHKSISHFITLSLMIFQKMKPYINPNHG